nr:MAG TPA: hypothetical protein [Crassvirales sp.]
MLHYIISPFSIFLIIKGFNLTYSVILAINKIFISFYFLTTNRVY